MAGLKQDLITSIFGSQESVLDGITDLGFQAIVGRLARYDVEVETHAELKAAVESTVAGQKKVIAVKADIKWPTLSSVEYDDYTIVVPPGANVTMVGAKGLLRRSKATLQGLTAEGTPFPQVGSFSFLLSFRVPIQAPARQPDLGAHCTARPSGQECAVSAFAHTQPHRLSYICIFVRVQTKSAIVVCGEFRTTTTVSALNPGSTVAKGELTLKNMTVSGFVIRSPASRAEILTDPNFTNPGNRTSYSSKDFGYDGYYGAFCLVLVSLQFA